MSAREKAAHIFERETHDHYVEPAWVVDLLIDAERFTGQIWDPACGFGTIPKRFDAIGHPATGTDIVDRGFGLGGQNFLAMSTNLVRKVDSIVTNPPFKHTEAFIRQALKLTTDRVAVLVPLKWLASQTRFDLFEEIGRPARVHVLSNRASMPPGRFIDPETGLFNCDDPNPSRIVQYDHSVSHKFKWRKGDKPSGGAVDYCWVVFQHGHGGETVMNWLARGGVKAKLAARKRSVSSAEQALSGGST